MNSTTHPAGTRFVTAASGSRATVNGWRGTSVSITWDEGGTSYAPASHFGRTLTEAEYDAKVAEEDAAWEAEGRKVAQEVIAGQIAAMEDHILDAFRNDLHRERRDLVNLYTGSDRKTKISDLDLVIGAVEEEQAKRAGLASSADILAGLRTENLTLSVYEAEALPRPAEEAYEVGQRVLMINLPHIGATVRSIDEAGIGIDYDTDDAEERGTYAALYEHIRPMPLH